MESLTVQLHPICWLHISASSLKASARPGFTSVEMTSWPGRLKFHYFPDEDDNFMVSLQDACRNTFAFCWIKLLPALLITAWELLVGWPWPYCFTWAAHPIHWIFSLIQILMVSLSIPTLIGCTIALVSKQIVKKGQSIQYSTKKSTRVINIK
jgi:hypothetical protein